MLKVCISQAHSLLQRCLQPLQHLDGLPSLFLRLYLVPIFWMAGMQKFNFFADTVVWFGDPVDGLGLPFPTLLAGMATAAELGGAILLTIGLATRWISLPLLVTMIIAIVTVHGQFGWQAIADMNAPFSTDRVVLAAEKLDRAKEILQMYGNYEWLTSSGSLAILNNGMEFAVTYMLMLLALMVQGGGRYVSVDHYIKPWITRFLAR